MNDEKRSGKGTRVLRIMGAKSRVRSYLSKNHPWIYYGGYGTIILICIIMIWVFD